MQNSGMAYHTTNKTRLQAALQKTSLLMISQTHTRKLLFNTLTPNWPCARCTTCDVINLNVRHWTFVIGRW